MWTKKPQKVNYELTWNKGQATVPLLQKHAWKSLWIQNDQNFQPEQQVHRFFQWQLSFLQPQPIQYNTLEPMQNQTQSKCIKIKTKENRYHFTALHAIINIFRQIAKNQGHTPITLLFSCRFQFIVYLYTVRIILYFS